MRQLKINKSITNRQSAALDKYLVEIGREELISTDEEVELAQRIHHGDREALEKLTRANLRFVVSVAKQYQNQGLALNDLIDEGNLGLIRAAQKFDETRGFKFISYAVWWIRQSILQAISEQSRIVRMPLNQVGFQSKLTKAIVSFEQKNERRPSVQELAEILDTDVQKVQDALGTNGKKVSEAYTMPVDAVSGATLSSNAIIENARRGFAYASKHIGQGTRIDLSVKFVVTLFVLLAGMILPIYFRAKKMRTAILVLDVVVLGLWSGTFISYSMHVGIASNGLPLTSIASLVPILLIIVAFIYPLFGKKAHYCTHICPFGAAQELANRIPCKNVRLGAKTIKALTEMRRILWWILTLLMLLGVCFEWMDYELFIAFIFSSAKNIIIVFAIVTLILSVFTPRPYCRFVCPTGYLLKLSFPHKRK